MKISTSIFYLLSTVLSFTCMQATAQSMGGAATNSMPKNEQASPSTPPVDSNGSSMSGMPGMPPSTNSMMSSSKGQMSNAMTSTPAALSQDDKTFMNKAAEGGMLEVQMGQLAQEKAKSADVKQFGAQMVSEHSKAGDELKSIAEQKGVTLPTELGSKNQMTLDHFKSLSSAAFDQAYLKAMVRDHKKDEMLFSTEASGGQDSDVKAFASKTLQMVKTHLAHAQSMSDKM